MTEQEYRQHPAVNKSTLWELRKSPAHYKWALEHQSKDTPALRFGRAFHMAVLQPDEFNQHYVLAPDVDRRTKEGREQWARFQSTLDDRELISKEDYTTVCCMSEAVWNDPDASELLEGCETEKPVFWVDEHTGIECKCKMDAVKPGTLVDLKSCGDASNNAFLREALRYGYDVQSAHYLRGYRSLELTEPNATFWFIAVEKSPPYAVNVIRASDAFIDRGTWALIDLMDKLKECRDKDEWPGYGKNEMVLPEWAAIPEDTE